MKTMAIITLVVYLLALVFVWYSYRRFKLHLFWNDIPIKTKRMYWAVQFIGYILTGLMFYWEWYWILTISSSLSMIGTIYNWKLYKTCFDE